MNSAEKCKSLCIDQGGTFCKPFGVYDWGYCCYTDMGLPCDKRTQACSNGNNEITRYFQCPFNQDVCGSSIVEVTEALNELDVTSAEFKGQTFCGYTFRNLNSIGKQINVKVLSADQNSELKVMQGDTLQKGYNVQSMHANNQSYFAKPNERIFLLAKGSSTGTGFFKIQYFLTTPEPQPEGNSNTPIIDLNNQTPTDNNQTSSTVGGTNTDTQTNKTTQEDTQYYYSSSSDDSGGSGTAIVIIIAVLIVIIPLGFIISCIIKKIREIRGENKKPEELMPLPDQSSNMSPERSSSMAGGNNLYPFNSPIEDPENMHNVMQAIQNMERNGAGQFNNGFGGDGSYMDGPQPVQFIEIPGKSGDIITIPVDQLPPFLQDMAVQDPQIFNELMDGMDEERLDQFIREQEMHQQQQNYNILSLPDHHENLHSDMGLNQMNFVDPAFLNEQQAAFDKHKLPSIHQKRQQQNFLVDEPDIEEEFKQGAPIPPQRIDIDENEQNLDILVGGLAGADIEQPKKKKGKKKKKKARNNPIEIVEDEPPQEMVQPQQEAVSEQPPGPIVFNPDE